jgi:hypothetical protein
MTPAQKTELRPYRQRLQTSFGDALLNAAKLGSARTWFVPYLASVLQVLSELNGRIVDGRSLRRTLAKDLRAACTKLLRKTCDRDPKTINRWAAVLVNAHNSGVSPEQFSDWLKDGGGAAGRAAQVAERAKVRSQPIGNSTS